METNHKKKYKLPVIEIIFLDNQISLELQSTPPDGPGEVVQNYTQQSDAVSNIFKT